LLCWYVLCFEGACRRMRHVYLLVLCCAVLCCGVLVLKLNILHSRWRVLRLTRQQQQQQRKTLLTKAQRGAGPGAALCHPAKVSTLLLTLPVMNACGQPITPHTTPHSAAPSPILLLYPVLWPRRSLPTTQTIVPHRVRDIAGHDNNRLARCTMVLGVRVQVCRRFSCCRQHLQT
jgi:hypothetical protein